MVKKWLENSLTSYHLDVIVIFCSTWKQVMSEFCSYRHLIRWNYVFPFFNIIFSRVVICNYICSHMYGQNSCIIHIIITVLYCKLYFIVYRKVSDGNMCGGHVNVRENVPGKNNISSSNWMRTGQKTRW